jgi:flagellar hook-length control protein FliK
MAKHPATDPVSAALTLLESALTGALSGAMAAGSMAGVPAGVPSSTPAASAAPASSPASALAQSALAATGSATTGNATAATLDTLLAQSLAAAPQATGATAAPPHGSSTSASPPATATASAAALMAAQLTSSAVGLPHARPDPATMTVSSPVGSNAWTEELGTKVTWMAHQGIESASLQLSPEHLGPLQVTISVRDGQASVWFGAAQPDTRTALQQSLPQLRQLFASQGLTLADAGVSRESPRGQDRQRPTRTGPSVSGVSAVNLDSPAGSASLPGRLGLVDTYA